MVVDANRGALTVRVHLSCEAMLSGMPTNSVQALVGTGLARVYCGRASKLLQ